MNKKTAIKPALRKPVLYPTELWGPKTYRDSKIALFSTLNISPGSAKPSSHNREGGFFISRNKINPVQTKEINFYDSQADSVLKELKI